MTPQMWVTVIFGSAQIIFTLLAAAVVYGSLREATKNNAAAIGKIEPKVERHEGEIGLVYGHLGLPR